MRSFVLPAAIGLAAGFVGGLFGVGGGVVIVPALVLLLDTDQRQASATSLAVIIFVAAAATARFAADDAVDWVAALLLFAGAGVGAVVGSRLLGRLSQVWIARAFVVVALVAAVRLAVTS